MSAEAMSRCRRICRKDGLFLGLQFLWMDQQCIVSNVRDTKRLFLSYEFMNKLLNIVLLPFLWPLSLSQSLNLLFFPVSLFISPFSSLSSPSVCSPALPQEQFEALWTAIRHRQLQAVISYSPDDSGGVHILVGHLSCQHFPQHNAEWPAYRRGTFTFRRLDKHVNRRKAAWWKRHTLLQINFTFIIKISATVFYFYFLFFLCNYTYIYV